MIHFPRLLLNKEDAEEIKALMDDPVVNVVDEFASQMEELEEICSLLERDVPSDSNEDVWVHYPWRNTVVRSLPKSAHDIVRLSRNRNLITEEEQTALNDTCVAVAGANAGNPIALCLSLEGAGNRMKVADNDILTLSNLNRFRAGLPDLGLNKATLTARQVYEVNPFADVTVLTDGVIKGGEGLFLEGVDVLVEEMDNIPLKLSIREKAREKGIPVIMVTGNEENLILDVERFDQDGSLLLLNDLLSDDVLDRTKNIEGLSQHERILLARDFIGEHELSDRLRESFHLVKKEIPGIPQLAESSFLRGAVGSYAVRMIALGRDMPSGRYHISITNLS